MKNKLLLLLIGYLLVINAVWWFQLGGEMNEEFENVLYLTAVIATFVSGLYAVSAYGFKSKHGRALGLITAGFGFWLLGEITWVIYDYILHIDPYPSLADFFFIAGYPLIVWGIVKELKLASLQLGKIHQGVAWGIVALGLIIFGLVSYFEIVLAYDSSLTLIENFAVVYGFADLILLIPALLVLALAWEYKGGKIFTPWIYIFIGLLLYLAADTLYAVFLTPYLDDVYPFESIDIFWISAYSLAALGLANMGLLIRRVNKQIQAQK